MLTAENSETSKIIMREQKNLEKIVSIHLSSFHEDELSMVLGKKFVERFYRSILSSDVAHIVIIREDEEIKSFMVYFTDYITFMKEFRSTLEISQIDFFRLVSNLHLIFNYLWINMIIPRIIPPAILTNALGVIAIAPETRGEIGVFTTLMTVYHTIVYNVFDRRCWGSCRLDNVVAARILERMGLDQTHKVGFLPRVGIYQSG